MQGPNDYASMYEVLTRRFERAKAVSENTSDSFLRLPDVIADTVAVEWMPGNSNIEVIKDSLIVHHDLAGHDLFGRAAIDADRSGCTGCVHIGF